MLLTVSVEGFVLSLAAEGRAQSTIYNHKFYMLRLAKFLNDPEIGAISGDDLRRWMVHLQERYIPQRFGGSQAPVSGSTRSSAWSAMRSYFRWAAEVFQLPNPALAIKKPQFQPPEITPLTEAEVRALLKACDLTREAKADNRRPWQYKRETALRDRALVLVLLDTGLRIGECSRLRVQDVNQQTGEVFVAPFGSGHKTHSRHVYLGKTARRALWLYLSQATLRPDESLWRSGTRSMSKEAMQEIVKSLGAKAGVRRIHPHLFRHTFAIQFLRGGGGVFALQRLLGHSSLEMVRHYVKLSDQDAATAHATAAPADRWRL